MRRVAKIRPKWQEKVADTEVLSRCGMTAIQALILCAQFRWAGHLVRLLFFLLSPVSSTRVDGPSSRAELTARELGCIF